MITEYDKELDKIVPNIFMYPWVGLNYKNAKILFIGESDYNDGTNFHITWKREWIHFNRIQNYNTDSKLLNKIDELIFFKNSIICSKQNLWNSVAYTNLVQRPMDWNLKETPNNDDLKIGWKVILQKLLILRPEIIIKWGVKGDNILLDNINLGNFHDWEYEVIDNKRFINLKYRKQYSVKILFVHHPSYRFLSIEKVNSIIYNAFPELKIKLNPR